MGSPGILPAPRDQALQTAQATLAKK